MAIIFSIISITLAVISIGLAVYSLFQKPPTPPVPSPDQLTGVPTAEQGKPIPVLFGTRLISQPNVVWYATGVGSKDDPTISLNGLTPPLRIMIKSDDLTA